MYQSYFKNLIWKIFIFVVNKIFNTISFFFNIFFNKVKVVYLQFIIIVKEKFNKFKQKQKILNRQLYYHPDFTCSDASFYDTATDMIFVVFFYFFIIFCVIYDIPIKKGVKKFIRECRKIVDYYNYNNIYITSLKGFCLRFDEYFTGNIFYDYLQRKYVYIHIFTHTLAMIYDFYRKAKFKIRFFYYNLKLHYTILNYISIYLIFFIIFIIILLFIIYQYKKFYKDDKKEIF